MKKFIWTFGVLIFFAIGFAASDKSSEGMSESYDTNESEVVEDEESFEAFSNEQDVRNYLCTHRFSSRDGYTLSFSNFANEVSVNGQQLASYVEIGSISSYGALIRTHGPYGNTTFKLSISGSDGVLQDINDGETYYSR